MKRTTIILIILCMIGLGLLVYPSFADYWNANFTTRTISEYSASMDNIEEADFQALWEEAAAFNEELQLLPVSSVLPEDILARYEQCLNVDGNPCMGYIEIPKIGVTLLLYHGTSSTVLETGIGHIEWSSLPTGGPGTHCVLSGHRGLPSARLFTDLDLLREGDIFVLSILDRNLTYEIDQIRTVLPSDVEELQIVDGMDYCTLVTCTPYGINTHRLLVRGHRIENIAGNVHVLSEAVLIDAMMVALVLSIPIIFALFLMVMFKKPESKEDPDALVAEAAQYYPEERDPASRARSRKRTRVPWYERLKLPGRRTDRVRTDGKAENTTENKNK